MNPLGWSDDDRTEFDMLVDKALAIPSVAVRRSVFLDGLETALEARKLWARDVFTDYQTWGTDRLLKAEQEKRRPRVPVSYRGRVIGKMPRTTGVRRRDGNGFLEHQRALIEYQTWDELRARRSEYAAQVRALEVDIAGIDRLLELEDLVPGASTPAEACEIRGTTVEEWLSAGNG